jgi:hypothetical protein
MDIHTTIPEISLAATYQIKDPHSTNTLHYIAYMKGNLMHAIESCVVHHKVNWVGGEPNVGYFDEV